MLGAVTSPNPATPGNNLAPPRPQQLGHNRAFSLFEPLNTTGQPLTPIETLRPWQFRVKAGSTPISGPGQTRWSPRSAARRNDLRSPPAHEAGSTSSREPDHEPVQAGSRVA